MPIDEIVTIVIFVVVFVSLYIASSYFEVVMRGDWKFMAILALTVVFAIPIDISVGTAIDPTSHNLAPIEFVVYVVPSSLFFLLIVWMHGRFAKSDKPEKVVRNDQPKDQAF